MSKTMAEHLADNGCIDDVLYVSPRGFANEYEYTPVPKQFEAAARRIVDDLSDDVNAQAFFVPSKDLPKGARLAVLDWLDPEYSDSTINGVPSMLWDHWCVRTFDGETANA